MLNLDGPPKFKTKKMAADDFEDLIGDLHVSIRYVFFRRYLLLFSLMTFASIKKVRRTSSHVRGEYPMEARPGHLQVQWFLREIESELLNES
jgi:hypothetical protein